MDFLKPKASLAFLKLENKKIRASMGLLKTFIAKTLFACEKKGVLTHLMKPPIIVLALALRLNLWCCYIKH
ncbi:hypothetical protein HpNP52_28210 [Helicobacter pylori]